MGVAASAAIIRVNINIFFIYYSFLDPILCRIPRQCGESVEKDNWDFGFWIEVSAVKEA
jgi:hypothetical protein